MSVALALGVPRALAAAAPPESGVGALRAAVVPVIVGAEGLRPTLSVIYRAVSEAVRFRRGVHLVLEEESFGRALECGADERCVAGELSAAGVELGFLVVVNAELAPALVGVKLIEAQSGKRIAESVAQIAPTSPGMIAAAVAERVREVMERAGYREGGRLRVKIAPAGAVVVRIDGAAPREMESGSYFLDPGPHTVRVEREDHLPQTIEVEVKAGAERPLEVVLVPEERLIESPLLWVGVGAAVVGAAAAMLIFTRSTERYKCAPFDGVDCTP